MAQIKDTIDEIRNRIVDEITDLMNQYGLKEWVFGFNNDSATMWERMDDDTVVRSWVNTIRLDDNNILTLDIDYEGHSNNDCPFDLAFMGVFTDSMVELLDKLCYELRNWFTNLILVDLRNQAKLRPLDGTFTMDGFKPISMRLSDSGNDILLTENGSGRERYLSDFPDEDFPNFAAYFRTQIKNTYSIRVSQVASRTIEVVADNYDQAVAMAKAEVEQHPINAEDVDSIQFN